MFRFERCATVKTAGDLPAAVQFATEVTGYLNKRHSIQLSFGIELFGEPCVHWYLDADSIDKMTQLQVAMLKDRDYLGMLDRVKGIWVEGSLKDTIVSLTG